jgi:hypothetical protein
MILRNWGVDVSHVVTLGELDVIKQHDYVWIGRYLSDSSNSKSLSWSEALRISDSGLYIVSIYETNPTSPEYFWTRPADRGWKDGISACKYAESVHQPKGSTIYMTVDYDASEYDVPNIKNYLTICKQVLDNNDYTLGLYGSGFILTECKDLITHSWLAMSRGWAKGKKVTTLPYDIIQYPGQISGTDLDMSNGSAGGWKL